MVPLHGAAVALVGLLRLAELAYARFTERRLRARGARGVRPDGYALIVLVQVMWLAGVLVESQAGPGRLEPALVGLAMFFAGTALRYWSMAALGWRWSTRVFLVDEPLVARGPYRFVRHPIYLGVTLELVGLPLAFGAWWTLALVLPLHAVAIANRVRIEGRAIRDAYGTA